jgi:hypothetical protein
MRGFYERDRMNITVIVNFGSTNLNGVIPIIIEGFCDGNFDGLSGQPFADQLCSRLTIEASKYFTEIGMTVDSVGIPRDDKSQ